MPPGVEQWGFIEAFNAFLAGDIAMTISWPPVGRWAAGYGKGTEALNWIPETKVADKIGYALPPGGTSGAGGRFLAWRGLRLQEQGSRLPVHPVDEQRGHQPPAGAAALRAA